MCTADAAATVSAVTPTTWASRAESSGREQRKWETFRRCTHALLYERDDRLFSLSSKSRDYAMQRASLHASAPPQRVSGKEECE